MKPTAKLTPKAKYRTHTGETVQFVREEHGIAEYRNSDGATVPMHSDLFRAWAKSKVRSRSKASR